MRAARLCIAAVNECCTNICGNFEVFREVVDDKCTGIMLVIAVDRGVECK